MLEKLPGPWRITFDTNPDDCNLHCIMCEEHSLYSSRQAQRQAKGLPPRRMDFDLIRRVVAEAGRYGLKEIIPSTMGEPLLYRHFEALIELCRRYGVKLNLTTNGTFPGRSVEEWGALIVPVTSDVKISWNGARAETAQAIMVGTRFEKVLENVRRFLRVRDRVAAKGRHRCRVTFQLTFMANNVEELPDIVRLAAGLGVDRVKGHHLWVHFPATAPLSMRRSPRAIAAWNRVVEQTFQTAEEHRLPWGDTVLLENIHPLDPEGAELVAGGLCPFLGREAWVSATGRFDPCCAPDEQRQTLGYFGRLQEKSLMEVWNSQAYEALMDNYLENELCRSCNMRRPVEELINRGAC